MTLFRCADPVLLRAPALPVSSLRQTWLDIPADTPDEADRLTELLRELGADAQFRAALEVSSPSICQMLDNLPAKLPALRRAAFAVTLYRLRMAGRPTPFGLMAGVAAATFAETAKVRFGTNHRVVRRKAGSDPADRLAADNLAGVRGDRLVLPTRGGERSVRHTRAVRAAMKFAASPVSRASLLDQLDGAFPQAGAHAVAKLVDDLTGQGFLVTGVRPESGTPDLALDADVQLPAAVGDELARTASLLWRMAPARTAPPQLRHYHERFIFRTRN